MTDTGGKTPESDNAPSAADTPVEVQSIAEVEFVDIPMYAPASDSAEQMEEGAADTRDGADRESRIGLAPIPHRRGWRGILCAPCVCVSGGCRRMAESCARNCHPRAIRSRLSFHCLCSCFILSRRRDYVAFSFIFAAYGFLYPGLFNKVIHLEQTFPGNYDESERSTWETVHYLLKEGGQYLFPGVLLCFFSICVPFIKGILLVFALICGRKPRLLRFVARISKYQVVDIFVTILLIGFLNNHFIKARVCDGFYYFLGYCVASIIGTTILATGEDTREPVRPIGLLWFAMTLIMLISLAFMLFLPLFQVGPTYKKVILDSVNRSVFQLIFWLLGNGFVPQGLLVGICVIVLPVVAYVILPLLSIRDENKSRLISIAHEWAMADTWFIAFLVCWTSFDTNAQLNVQVSNAGTYFNLLYGCSAFIIIHLIVGEPKIHRMSETAIEEAEETGQDIQLLARQIDRRNFKRKTSMASLLVLGILPGAIFGWLVHVEGLYDVDLGWLNREIMKHYVDANKAMKENIPSTIGCCVNRPDNCNPNIAVAPYDHPGVDDCVPVGDHNLLYYDNSHWAYMAAVRWLTNLKTVQLNGKDAFRLTSFDKSGRPSIRFSVRGHWENLPLSLYVQAAKISIFDNQDMCCNRANFTINVTAECFSDYPYLRNFDVETVAMDHDIIIKFKLFGKTITLYNLSSDIENNIRASILDYATVKKFDFWSDGEPATFMGAINHLIQLNVPEPHLKCPAPSSDTRDTMADLAGTAPPEVIVIELDEAYAQESGRSAPIHARKKDARGTNTDSEETISAVNMTSGEHGDQDSV
eukprot:GEMP01003281.1.p1 GENE.GEMP01003281.1~~GEMP01003281.1.p1  ORF type:complete len:812 (+),score=99.97 GEMP01003281.1:127-2562(+)